jgi:hypothetical protein
MPDQPGVIASAVFVSLLVGAVASFGLWQIGLALVVIVAFPLIAFAAPERCALALLAVLPFLIAPLKIGDFALFLGMPAAFLIGISLLLRSYGAGNWRMPRVLGPVFVLLLVVMIISTVLSNDPMRGASRIANVTIFATFAWGLGTAIASKRITVQQVALAFVFGATLAGVALTAQGLAQFVVGQGRVLNFLRDVKPLLDGRQGGGLNWQSKDPDMLRAIFPFMTPPSAGQYMAAGLVGGTWLLFEPSAARRDALRPLLMIAIVIMTVALLLTLSRQGWIGAGVGVVAVIIRAKRGLLLATAIPFILVAAVTPIPGSGGTFGEYLWHAKDTKSGQDRPKLWSEAINISKAYPVHGVGPGQYGDLSGDPSRPFYAHNLYLDQLVELGYPGGIVFASFALALLALAWTRGNALAFGLLAGYAAANFFDDVFYFPRNGIALATAIALLAATRERSQVHAPVLTGPDPPLREREPVPALSGA